MKCFFNVIHLFIIEVLSGEEPMEVEKNNAENNNDNNQNLAEEEDHVVNSENILNKNDVNLLDAENSIAEVSDVLEDDITFDNSNADDFVTDHQYILDNNALAERKQVFQSICNKETVLTPPSDTWGICLNKKYGFISLQEVHATSLEKCRGEPPLFQKQVS